MVQGVSSTVEGEKIERERF